MFEPDDLNELDRLIAAYLKTVSQFGYDDTFHELLMFRTFVFQQHAGREATNDDYADGWQRIEGFMSAE